MEDRRSTKVVDAYQPLMGIDADLHCDEDMSRVERNWDHP